MLRLDVRKNSVAITGHIPSPRSWVLMTEGRSQRHTNLGSTGAPVTVWRTMRPKLSDLGLDRLGFLAENLEHQPGVVG